MLLAIMVSLVEFVSKSIFPQISELHRSPGSLHYSPGEVEEQEPLRILQGKLGEFRMPSHFHKPAHSTSNRKASVKVFRFEAPLWFANASNLSDLLLLELRGVALRGVVLDMSTVPWMDSTAANIMSKALAAAAEKNIMVFFANIKPDVKYLLVQLCNVEEARFFKTLHAAEMAVRAGLPSVDAPSCVGDNEEIAVLQIESESDDSSEGAPVPKCSDAS
jgi:MFS superfamily sulfate permease-like transporter